KMPRVLGQPGGPVIKGFNAPNRVIITRNAQPGQRIQLAVFGINGPISYSPQNFKRRRQSSEKILRLMRSFQPARRSKNWREDFYSPRDQSGFRAWKTQTATFSLAIPTTTSSTVGHKTDSCRSS